MYALDHGIRMSSEFLGIRLRCPWKEKAKALLNSFTRLLEESPTLTSEGTQSYFFSGSS